jgi:hypothetical protein
VDPNSITWKLTGQARVDVAEDRAALGEEEYLRDRDRMRIHLCDYFNGAACVSKAGNISPIGKNSAGGKILKMRWGRPGCGKSGGIRLCIVAFCSERIVVLCRAFLRKDDPDDREFLAAAELE